MTRAHRVVMAATAAITTGLLGACSSGSTTTGSESENTAESPAESVSMTPGAVTCRADATAVPTPYPAAVPAELPLPPDTVIYSVDDRGESGVVLTGVSGEPLDSVREFLNTEWPKAGYQLLQGETEELDAESNWEFGDYQGRWAIQDVSAACDGETAIQVLSTK